MAKTPGELNAALNALDAEIAAVSGQRKALKQTMRALVADRDKLLAAASAAAKLAAISPAERAALQEVLQASA